MDRMKCKLVELCWKYPRLKVVELRDVQRRSKREKDEVWNSRISVSGSKSNQPPQ